MSPRYLLVVGDQQAPLIALLQSLAISAKLKLVYSNPRVAVLANSSCRCVPVGEMGCILGWLFPRDGPAQQLKQLSTSQMASLARSYGQALLRSFWGGYVAALSGAGSVRILRDPSGTFPCYYGKVGMVQVFASDADLLVNSGVSSAKLDLHEIGRQLYRAFVPASGTALRGIRELLAGFALRIPPRDDNQEPCWSPWDYVSGDDAGPEENAERLSAIVQHCVGAWASTSGRLVLNVSGGLDSSIVAASLAKRSADAVCLTMYTDDPGGDERLFARQLCDRLGLQLLERAYRLEDIDICKPLASHLPRPRDRTQALAFERANLEVAACVGADAFMTGNGGDNVFGYSQSAVAVADLYLARGFGKDLLAILLDVCRQTGCSITDAFIQAWRLAHAPPDYRVRPNPLFLHPDVARSSGAHEPNHPWLAAPEGSLPGKAAHIATILRSQPCIESSRGKVLPVLNPLVSQPIIEACLQIPSWQWRTGGRDRSVARAAFAKELPPLVLNRRIKGTPSGFAAKLLDHFRASIRERLLEGSLARNRLIHSAAIEEALAKDRPVPDLQRVRILELVNVEAWVDHWEARAAAPEPDSPNFSSSADAPSPLSRGPRP